MILKINCIVLFNTKNHTVHRFNVCTRNIIQIENHEYIYQIIAVRDSVPITYFHKSNFHVEKVDNIDKIFNVWVVGIFEYNNITFDEKRMYNVSTRVQIIFVNMAVIIIPNFIYLNAFKPPSFSTAISRWKHWFSSDHRSKANRML